MTNATLLPKMIASKLNTEITQFSSLRPFEDLQGLRICFLFWSLNNLFHIY